MAIITITRGSYNRGKEVAEKLALKLGYECISRDILLEASGEFNIPEIKLVRALHDAPSVLERFQYGKERYLSYLKSALLQHAKNDNMVYHGVAGHYLLRNIPHVLKVRIIADMNERVKEEMKRAGISAEKALYILRKDDEERRQWSIQVYGTDSHDCRLYDMVLNIQTLSVDDAVQILFDTARTKAFTPTPQSLKLLQDLALATKVQAALVQTAPGVTVAADGGRIFIGVSIHAPQSEALIASIRKIAETVEGVSEVCWDATGTHVPTNHVNPFHNI